MGGRNSIVGLSLRLARARGLSRWHAITPAIAVVSLAALVARSRAVQPVRAPVVRSESAFDCVVMGRARVALDAARAAIADSNSAIDVSVAPSADGWMASWVRALDRRTVVVETASLRRDGTLRAPPRALVTDRAFAWRTKIVAAGDRFVVGWIEAIDQSGAPMRPMWAVIDHDGNATLAPRPVGFADGFPLEVGLAFNGRLVAIAARGAVRRSDVDMAIRTLDGAVIADLVSVGDARGFSLTLAASNTDWLVAYDDTDFTNVRTNLRLRRFSMNGALRDERVVQRFEGLSSEFNMHTRGAVTYLAWGADGGPITRRFDPYFARVVDGAVSTPVSLGARRTASNIDLACNDTGCTFAWMGVASLDSESPEWITDRRDVDGRLVHGPFRLAAAGRLGLFGRATVAASASGDAFVSIAQTRDGLMSQRLDAEGRPQGEPRRIVLDQR